jgi:hypothetical protein
VWTTVWALRESWPGQGRLRRLVRSTADWGLDMGDHRQENDIQGRGENCVIRAFIIGIIVQSEYVLPYGYSACQDIAEANRPTRAGGSWQEANRTKGEKKVGTLGAPPLP